MCNGRNFQQRRILSGLSVCAAIAFGIFGVPAAGLAATTCQPVTETDYLKPLEGLPQVRRLPKNGHIHFAPQHLFVQPLSPLLAGGGGAGVEIGSDSPKGTFKLGWTVELTVRRVSSAGSPRAAIGRKRLVLKNRRSYWNNPAHLQIYVPPRPGFLVSELKIAEGLRSPATFSQYIRVVPQRVDIRLHLDRSNYARGETVSLQLENRGTVGAVYGYERWLERWDGMSWQLVDDQPEFFSGRAFSLSPGRAGRCEHLVLPTNLQPGQYRLAKDVGVGRKGRTLRGYFAVS